MMDRFLIFCDHEKGTSRLERLELLNPQASFSVRRGMSSTAIDVEECGLIIRQDISVGSLILILGEHYRNYGGKQHANRGETL